MCVMNEFHSLIWDRERRLTPREKAEYVQLNARRPLSMQAETARIQKEAPRKTPQTLNAIQRARNGHRTIPQPHLPAQKGRRMMGKSKRA